MALKNASEYLGQDWWDSHTPEQRYEALKSRLADPSNFEADAAARHASTRDFMSVDKDSVDALVDYLQAKGELSNAAKKTLRNNLPVKRDAAFRDIPISVEFDTGDQKTGTDPEGTPWAVDYIVPYGFIPGTMGADGEELDAYLGPDQSAENVYVVSQNKRDGSFDEHKAVFGAPSKEDAEWLYRQHHNGADWAFGGIEQLSLADFKAKHLSNGAPLDENTLADVEMFRRKLERPCSTCPHSAGDHNEEGCTRKKSDIAYCTCREKFSKLTNASGEACKFGGGSCTEPRAEGSSYCGTHQAQVEKEVFKNSGDAAAKWWDAQSPAKRLEVLRQLAFDVPEPHLSSTLSWVMLPGLVKDTIAEHLGSSAEFGPPGAYENARADRHCYGCGNTGTNLKTDSNGYTECCNKPVCYGVAYGGGDTFRDETGKDLGRFCCWGKAPPNATQLRNAGGCQQCASPGAGPCKDKQGDTVNLCPACAVEFGCTPLDAKPRGESSMVNANGFQEAWEKMPPQDRAATLRAGGVTKFPDELVTTAWEALPPNARTIFRLGLASGLGTPLGNSAEHEICQDCVRYVEGITGQGKALPGFFTLDTKSDGRRHAWKQGSGGHGMAACGGVSLDNEHPNAAFSQEYHKDCKACDKCKQPFDGSNDDHTHVDPADKGLNTQRICDKCATQDSGLSNANMTIDQALATCTANPGGADRDYMLLKESLLSGGATQADIDDFIRDYEFSGDAEFVLRSNLPKPLTNAGGRMTDKSLSNAVGLDATGENPRVVAELKYREENSDKYPWLVAYDDQDRFPSSVRFYSESLAKESMAARPGRLSEARSSMVNAADGQLMQEMRAYVQRMVGTNYDPATMRYELKAKFPGADPAAMDAVLRQWGDVRNNSGTREEYTRKKREYDALLAEMKPLTDRMRALQDQYDLAPTPRGQEPKGPPEYVEVMRKLEALEKREEEMLRDRITDLTNAAPENLRNTRKFQREQIEAGKAKYGGKSVGTPTFEKGSKA